MARILILLTFSCLATVLTNCQDLISPCPKFFAYDINEDEQGRWYGNLTLLSNVNLDGIWLRLLFSNAPLHVEFQNQFGELDNYGSVNYIIKNVDYELKANTPLMLRFYVQYDTSKPVPLLIGIRLNAETICAEEEPDNISDPASSKTRDETTTVSEECPLQTDSPSHGTFENPNDICGRPSLTKPESLVLEENSPEGKWPWIVGLYTNLLGNLRYKCGGALISDSFIMTTAFCTVVKATGDAYHPNRILAFLGTTTLKDFSAGLQVATISRIAVHPQYTTVNYDNNIAILKTKRPVEYTYFVKPVCLWTGDNNISRLYEKIGNAISWSTDPNGSLSTNIAQYQLVIIDNISCVYASRKTFRPFVHARGFCTAPHQGSSAFSGDAGSSLVVKEKNDNGEDIWYLRGLTSTCSHGSNNRCDPNYYPFFMDVAKYIPWIKTQTNNI